MNAKRNSRRFFFEHTSGTLLFPYMLKNRRSGRIAYRVAPPGSGANRVENQTELEDIEEVHGYVVGRGWSVRMKSEDGALEGLYNKDGYSIVRCTEGQALEP